MTLRVDDTRRDKARARQAGNRSQWTVALSDPARHETRTGDGSAGSIEVDMNVPVTPREERACAVATKNMHCRCSRRVLRTQAIKSTIA